MDSLFTKLLVIQKYRPGEVAYFQDRLTSGKSVVLLFDPAHPKHVLFPETL
jgi:hypothetical protein